MAVHLSYQVPYNGWSKRTIGGACEWAETGEREAGDGAGAGLWRCKIL